jgi:hypothetical protein
MNFGYERELLRMHATYVVITVLLGFHGHDIRIKVLNGRNGRPIVHECVNVWVGPAHGAAVVVPTDNDGIALIHLAAIGVDGSPGSRVSACNGMGAIDPIFTYSDTIRITSGYSMPCQAHPPDSPWLTFSVNKVLQSGDATANHCGKTEASPKAGELIFFVRPLHWWEALRN